METVSYFTRESLQAANKEAIGSGRNRSLIPEKLAELLAMQPDETRYPVTYAFPHGETEVRCGVVLTIDVVVGWLDVPVAMYNALPTALLGDDEHEPTGN